MTHRRTKITVPADISDLSTENQQALEELKRVVPLVDALYRKQVPRAGVQTFYPDGLTAREFEKYLVEHPEKRDVLESHFTVVRKNGEQLTAIPYSEEYKRELMEISAGLRVAAQKISHPNLKTFIETRASDFENNDFTPGDLLWIPLSEAPIELTIGPYEEYEDMIWGKKRSFEIVISTVLKEENARLADYQKWAGEFDNELAQKYGYTPGSSTRTMLIVDEVAAGGHSKAGYTPMAYNLPNDTEIKIRAGSKQVFLRNIIRAKFQTITLPIAQLVVSPEVANSFSADDYTLFIIGHELAHGLGLYCKDGLRELGHGLEEGKADVFGLLFLYWLADRGHIPQETARAAAIAKVIDGLRQIRFGQEEAHAIGTIIQYRWLLSHGGLMLKNGKFILDEEKIRASEESLGDAFAQLALSKDYTRAAEFVNVWGKKIEEFEPVLAGLSNIPVDIEPEFEIRGRI
ncbi:MAG: hypothetical protein AMXMBFR44_4400 [Candidatus Campbellbacteria bacterium]